MNKKFLTFFIMLTCLLSLSCLVFADVGTDYVATGGYKSSDVLSLKYVLSGGNSSYQTNIMKAGANQWNGITSKVSVSLNSTGAKMSIFCTTGTETGVVGEMFPYYRGFLNVLRVDENLNQIWECTECKGYDNKMIWPNSGRTFSDSEKKCVYTHEVGHALSLKDNGSLQLLIMNPLADNSTCVNGPQADDKGNLKLKWGY